MILSNKEDEMEFIGFLLIIVGTHAALYKVAGIFANYVTTGNWDTSGLSSWDWSTGRLLTVVLIGAGLIFAGAYLLNWLAPFGLRVAG